MDMKTKVLIEFSRKDENSERNYAFLMPYGCKLGEAYDVCHGVLQKLVEMTQEAAEKTKQQKEESKSEAN